MNCGTFDYVDSVINTELVVFKAIVGVLYDKAQAVGHLIVDGTFENVDSDGIVIPLRRPKSSPQKNL